MNSNNLIPIEPLTIAQVPLKSICDTPEWLSTKYYSSI